MLCADTREKNRGCQSRFWNTKIIRNSNTKIIRNNSTKIIRNNNTIGNDNTE